MIRRSALTTAFLLATGLLAPAGTLHAQMKQRPFEVGLGAGASMPLGASGDQLVLGWHALGSLALSTRKIPVGLRLDAAYDRFQFERALLGAAGPPGAQRVVSFSANPVFKLPSSSEQVTPYFLGGVGSYSVGCTISSTACRSSTDVGWNVGGGASFQLFGLRAFAEGRYHRINQSSLSLQYLPITFGLLF